MQININHVQQDIQGRWFTQEVLHAIQCQAPHLYPASVLEADNHGLWIDEHELDLIITALERSREAIRNQIERERAKEREGQSTVLYVFSKGESDNRFPVGDSHLPVHEKLTFQEWENWVDTQLGRIDISTITREDLAFAKYQLASKKFTRDQIVIKNNL